MDDEILIAFLVMDLEVGEIGMDTESQIRGKCPGSCGPSKEGGARIVNEGESDGDYKNCQLLIEKKTNTNAHWQGH